MSHDEIKLSIPKREGQISALFSRGGPREGAGRRGIGHTRKVSVTLPPDAWEQFEHYCAEHRLSKSELLRELLLERFAPQNREDA
ncbi:ribbon-helix-helix protein, CopG family [Paenibacillus hodogayensis]|uniref:Ribbon-helix-helix protein, CopG family n=1 Tax=Paenibacillus hodogayensis TaxID=279208 RepID=A0ABV5VRT4_9BACL